MISRDGTVGELVGPDPVADHALRLEDRDACGGVDENVFVES
jgi:hypothetical protein